MLTAQASVGTVHYLPEKSAFVWRIKQLGGGREYLMRAHFGLPSVKGDEAIENRAPITVRFEIPCASVAPTRTDTRAATSPFPAFRSAI